jgi:hypothetical protein
MTEFVLLMVLLIALGWPLGHCLAAVLRAAPLRSDVLFRWIERPLYALLGIRPDHGPLLALPYARPANDICLLHGAKWSPQAWADARIDQIDEMRVPAH